MKISLLVLLIVLGIAPSSGQKNNKKITITGIVVDGVQKPVVNAMIMVDEKKTSSVTDSKGWYQVKVKPDANKIGIFTFANGLTEELIKGRTIVNITVGALATKKQPDQKETASKEEEINVGYGTVQKQNLTGSVGKIDGTNKKYASYTSIFDMIRGEVAGVQVDGESIKIRGESSLTLSTEPLLIVDGITVSTISNISPQMVKSIEVLKGSAASIYGSQGGNGVILITLFRDSEKK